MIDPMTASVSDFARLIAFTEASKPSGFGVGQIEWCSQEGTCLPLQVLSDYVPTLINGMWGPDFTKFFFIFLIVFFLMMASLACWRFLTGNGGNRFIAMTAFFLLIASLFQTVVTFFGNWRLIPLTGLGTPLLSIGLSAMLAPTLAIALVLVWDERVKELP
jgi:cell division protein FtsW (lipid II flippase)